MTMRSIGKTLGGLLFAVFIVAFTTGCEKYEDGGLVRKAEKSLTANDWKLTNYYRSGTDETSQLLISNFIESFAEDGTLTRNFTDKDGELLSHNGAWQFDSNKQQIKLSGVGSIEITEVVGTVSSSDYNILKLNDGELWYSYQNGSDENEFHFVAN